MNISIFDDCLPLFKALSCETRLDIVKLVLEQPMNQRELSEKLNISPAIVSGHVKQLVAAGILFTDQGKGIRGRQQVCYTTETSINISLREYSTDKSSKYAMPVGMYSKHKVVPSCGIASVKQLIGALDDPLTYLDPARSEAELLWFTKGYVEYVVPNKIQNRSVKKLSISAELGSEHPGSNPDWPSDISFYVNGVKIAEWTCPGNYGDRRGKFTPVWWPVHFSQYGILKSITTDSTGTYVDEEKVSSVTIDDLNINSNRFYVRFSVEQEAKNAGGLTIYGKGFGDYDQDILVTTYHE